MNKLTSKQQEKLYKIAVKFLDKMDAAECRIDESLACYYMEDNLRPLLKR